MKTSPWDPDENLPRDYAKIFKVGEREWDAVGLRLSGGMEEGVEVNIEFFTSHSILLTFAVQPGTRVTVDIADVPQSVMEFYDPKKPFVIFGLHQHEHKKTVINFTIQRSSEFQGIIKSKVSLLVVGFIIERSWRYRIHFFCW
jgi:pre-rRNA-processing protein TSR1